MRLGKSLTDNLICSRERIISSLQDCRSSDTVFSCDCSVACPSPKRAAWRENCLRPYNGFPFLWTMSHGDIQPRSQGLSSYRNEVGRYPSWLWPLEEPTVFPMRWVLLLHISHLFGEVLSEEKFCRGLRLQGAEGMVLRF